MIVLLEAVREVQAFLESEDWSFMVIGGLAMEVCYQDNSNNKFLLNNIKLGLIY